MQGIELKIMTQGYEFLHALEKGEETVTDIEIWKIVYEGKTTAFFDYNKLRYDIFKLALDKGWIKKDEKDLERALLESPNNYIQNFLIEFLLDKNPLSIKPKLEEKLKRYARSDKYAKKLSDHWDKYKIKVDEISALKKIIFGKIALFDFYEIKDVNKLADISCNERLQNIITQPDFIEKYPLFGNKIKENFEKGVARSIHLATALNSFFYYNKNPVLDEYCSREVLKYLDKESLKNVTQVTSLFFNSADSANIANKTSTATKSDEVNKQLHDSKGTREVLEL